MGNVLGDEPGRQPYARRIYLRCDSGLLAEVVREAGVREAAGCGDHRGSEWSCSDNMSL